jgi:hypothetical protein
VREKARDQRGVRHDRPSPTDSDRAGAFDAVAAPTRRTRRKVAAACSTGMGAYGSRDRRDSTDVYRYDEQRGFRQVRTLDLSD